MYSDAELKFYDQHNVKRPTHEPHGVSLNTIGENLHRLRPYAWRLEGNNLIGATDMGPLVQTIPTDVILVGTDREGLPVFQKVTLQ